MSTVIVSCKDGAGFDMEVNGVIVKINGYNSKSIMMIEHGEQIGVTYDVDEAFFDAWYAKHKDHPLCSGGFVFKSKTEKSAKDEAKEKRSVKTGTEQKTPQELEKVSGAVKLTGE